MVKSKSSKAIFIAGIKSVSEETRTFGLKCLVELVESLAARAEIVFLGHGDFSESATVWKLKNLIKTKAIIATARASDGAV